MGGIRQTNLTSLYKFPSEATIDKNTKTINLVKKNNARKTTAVFRALYWSEDLTVDINVLSCVYVRSCQNLRAHFISGFNTFQNFTLAAEDLLSAAGLP